MDIAGRLAQWRERRRAKEEEQENRNPYRKWLTEIAIVVVTALVLSFLIKTFLVRPFFIPSSSMEQTLLVGDRIFVNEIGPNFTGIHRGDIVVFKDTQGWLPESDKRDPGPVINALAFIGLVPDPSNDYLIKRVIGVGGDHIQCCDASGRIMVNGKGVDEPYAVQPTTQVDFDITVPADSFWVMGDNRPNSADSRFHQTLASKGFVARKDVVGTAAIVVWPLDRWRLLGNDKANYGP